MFCWCKLGVQVLSWGNKRKVVLPSFELFGSFSSFSGCKKSLWSGHFFFHVFHQRVGINFIGMMCGISEFPPVGVVPFSAVKLWGGCKKKTQIRLYPQHEFFLTILRLQNQEGYFCPWPIIDRWLPILHVFDTLQKNGEKIADLSVGKYIWRNGPLSSQLC